MNLSVLTRFDIYRYISDCMCVHSVHFVYLENAFLKYMKSDKCDKQMFRLLGADLLKRAKYSHPLYRHNGVFVSFVDATTILLLRLLCTDVFVCTVTNLCLKHSKALNGPTDSECVR